MPLKIVNDNIQKIKCDAIVVFSDGKFAPVDKIGKEIHNAAGKELSQFCAKLGSARAGEARVSPAFNLGCEYVIHAVAPIVKSASFESELCSAYLESLKLCSECGCARVAVALAQGGSHYPNDKILKLAQKVIVEFLADHEMSVSLVVTGKISGAIDKNLHTAIESFLTSNYSAKSATATNTYTERRSFARYSAEQDDESGNVLWGRSQGIVQAECCTEYSVRDTAADINSILLNSSRLDNMLKNMDKGFRDTLFYYIDKKGLSDVECYKRSNVDKKTFSKIKCNVDYRPSKVTAVSFAVGLHLDMLETEHLLSTAGMCLSHSSKFDVIIEYFITSGTYETIFDVNEVLYQFDQSLLGV